MIYRFKLVSDEVNNFYRVIEMDSDGTFLDLRNAILDSVGYTKDNIDSFCLCSDDWERQEEVVLEDTGFNSSDRDLWLMDKTAVSELVEEEGQKLVFIFDNIRERAFFMELKQILTGKQHDHPVCTDKAGNPPRQDSDLDIDSLLETSAKTQAAQSEIFDEYGDMGFDSFQDGYNDDDISSFGEHYMDE